MATLDAYEKYKKVEVSTAPQNKLVVMMYEGAIKFLDVAIKAIEKKHGTEEAHNNIVKAQDVIYELLNSLNYDAGEISERLASIYTYMNQKLTEANVHKNKAPLIEVSNYLKELKKAWETAEANLNKPSGTSKTKTQENGGNKLNISG